MGAGFDVRGTLSIARCVLFKTRRSQWFVLFYPAYNPRSHDGWIEPTTCDQDHSLSIWLMLFIIQNNNSVDREEPLKVSAAQSGFFFNNILTYTLEELGWYQQGAPHQLCWLADLEVTGVQTHTHTQGPLPPGADQRRNTVRLYCEREVRPARLWWRGPCR